MLNKFLKFLAKQAQYISVRDINTLKLLGKITENQRAILNIFQILVFALDISECTIPGPVQKIINNNNPILAVNLRPWHHYDVQLNLGKFSSST